MSQTLTIAPFVTGLYSATDPWIAPTDAFTILSNFHVNKGRIEKRDGYRTFGALTPQAATVVINAVTQADPGEITTAALHGYSTGDKVFITAVGGMIEINNKIFTITVVSTTKFTIGIDTTNLTAYTAAGTAQICATATDRVMGIDRLVDSDGSQTLLAFNTRRAFVYNTASQVFDILDVANIFDGDDEDYMWFVNWQSSNVVNRLFFTNGKAYDGASLNGIRFYETGATTSSLVPNLNAAATSKLYGGKLIFVLGQRLVVLSTFENDGASTSTFPQRARWCAKQNTNTSATVPPGGWVTNVQGGGSFADAGTGDHIISAQALQNQIIVYFSNSVWTLLPTADPAKPFRWKKLNNFRACSGRMASVDYDKYVVGLGVRGITASDGNETRRIDDRIHDFIDDEINVGGFEKVFCKRSYAERRWWTLYPKGESLENSAALIYDDESGAYSTYDITMNCLGYGNFTYDYTLEQFTEANNQDLALDDMGDETLFSFYWDKAQEGFLGGDLFGEIYTLETTASDNGDDINSELYTIAWNPFKDEGAQALFPYIDCYFDTSLTAILTIEFYKDTEVSPYKTDTVDLLPDLNYLGSILGSTQANPCSVNAPDHGLSTGDIIYIYHVLGMTDINSGGTKASYTVTVVDANNFTLDDVDATSFAAYSGGGEFYQREFYRTKTWKRAFGGGIGFQHRVKVSITGMNNDFALHGMKPYFKPRGRRMID